jgi:hypothetical protein
MDLALSRQVWAGDVSLGVISIHMVIKTLEERMISPNGGIQSMMKFFNLRVKFTES